MMNCRAGNPILQNDTIGNFLANSKKGVILVSFGSVIKGSLITGQVFSKIIKIAPKIHIRKFEEQMA
jgi:hypothetical protein